LLLMGGDQIYFDSIWEDVKELKGWIGLPREEQFESPRDSRRLFGLSQATTMEV